jgi:hypothetical protein
MAVRSDLVAEIDTTLSGSGTLTGAWIDSGDVQSVHMVYGFTGSPSPVVSLDQSIDGTTVFSSDPWSFDSSRVIAARFFRLSVAGGGAGATFRASVRVVS